jgi:hypothetical protein
MTTNRPPGIAAKRQTENAERQTPPYWLVELLLPLGAEFNGMPSGPTCQPEFSVQPARKRPANIGMMTTREPVRFFIQNPVRFFATASSGWQTA